MNLRQLFCRHKMKVHTGRKNLEKTREKTSYTVFGLPVYCNFQHVLVSERCLKCEKEIQTKIKFMVDAESSSVLR